MPKLVVFSGAGLSAESGLETFRDNGGLWAQYDPMKVCNYENWLENFALVHRFYNLRREELGKVQPNAMHKFLATLPHSLKVKQDIEVIHITQNVDDLLERAGVSNVIHLHGELCKIICPKCEHIFDIGYTHFEPHNCPNCDYTKLKPFIVFFYERAPKYMMMHDIFAQLGSRDCVLVIGTSGNVVDISSIIALRGNSTKIGYTILNNLQPCPSIAESVFDKIFYKPTTQAIPEIQQELRHFFAS
ncbi:NAD-dependent deacetylase [Helicobacter sp. MIT 21-1697]|uniref:SIR2 family NAD-dependent protein deacylase n=1 Tax=Helicobacter sp. MIT 21-1697 TaxID=2993733 RepID=UPI00224A9BCB|nr:Sir2 family NAD-dependent protein deacetylase [Helicobacter sp. MIT 21-1697]MCX2716292.1 NAD-dependent deacetylase [Helicobacter sp. MIT 21-1697]